MSMRQSRDELIKRGVLKEIFEKGELMGFFFFFLLTMLGVDTHNALIHLINSRPLKCCAPDSAHLEI